MYFSDQEFLEKCSYKKRQRRHGKKQKTGMLTDRGHLMVKPEEGTAWTQEDNSALQYSKRSRDIL